MAKYSVHELCDAFSLPTGTYYNNLFRNKNEKSYLAERRAMLSGKISEIFNNSRQTYDTKRIRHMKTMYAMAKLFVALVAKRMSEWLPVSLYNYSLLDYQ